MSDLKNWKTLARKDIIKNNWVHLTSDRVETTNGIMEDFYLLHPRDWVLIIAKTTDEKFIIVDQYRHGIAKVTSEFPAGVIDGNEDPLVAAKRELLEETGHSGGDWKVLGQWPCNPANLTNLYTAYFAEGVELTSEQNLDTFENIEVKFLTQEEIKKSFVNQTIVNPFHELAWSRV
jgi:8-oxo-dGTP pyrophosphatase MutT (NUDIX family)